MAATTVKNDPIKNDKMKFRTQLVDGKPQIFFDTIDDSSTKTKSKRSSRTLSNASRLLEQQEKNKINNRNLPGQTGTNAQTMRIEQSSNKTRVNDEGSNLGVYMTMDELAELVKAVKDDAKNEDKKNAEIPEPPPRPPPQQPAETTTAPVVPRLDLTVEPQPPARISPREQALNIMADKKRQKWQRERAEIEKMQMEIEYDQLKHQLSPGQRKTYVSPERATLTYDFAPPANKPPPVPIADKPPPAPPLPQSLKQNEYQHDIPPKMNDDANNDVFKTRLLERKQQQWKQENAEKTPFWNPFGRPGAGAPNPNESQTHPPPPTAPYRPPPITQRPSDNSFTTSPSTFVHSDQTRIPAAMRTNLLFGDVRFDEDVKTAKEIERRQWLDDLQKQVEDNKRHRYTRQETDRRNDFLNESAPSIMQEAANRHQQQQQQQNGTSPARNPAVQQTNNKHYEIDDGQKSGKRAQLLDKLQRHGYPTDTISNGYQPTNERTGEKLFGPTYESASRQNISKVEPLHLNVAVDHQQTYRPADVRRGQAVNTVDSTFRSHDNSVHTELRIPPNRQAMPYAYEDSDLPSQVSNHHYQNSGYRNVHNQPGKNNPRMQGHEDTHPNRRTSTSTHHSTLNDDRTISQISHGRSHQPPMDIHHRPIWNYSNPQNREYVSNSKRDPHYEKRQRLKHFEQGNFDRVDDVQKKTCYNRWNSDSEIQQQQKKPPPTNRVRSTMSKATSYGNHKDESILNLLKMQHKQQQQEPFGMRKSASNHPRIDDDFPMNHEPSLEKYEHYPHEDEFEPSKPYPSESRSRDPSPPKQTEEVQTDDNYQPREWNETNRTNAPPQSRHDHILQQLSAIKENLVRRQRELATSTNPIPV